MWQADINQSLYQSSISNSVHGLSITQSRAIKHSLKVIKQPLESHQSATHESTILTHKSPITHCPSSGAAASLYFLLTHAVFRARNCPTDFHRDCELTCVLVCLVVSRAGAHADLVPRLQAASTKGGADCSAGSSAGMGVSVRVCLLTIHELGWSCRVVADADPCLSLPTHA